MAATSNTTKLEDIVNPQVMADDVTTKIFDRVRFAPLATRDDTLVGRDGDTLTFPGYGSIGTSEDVAEGTDIPIHKLEQITKSVKVSKIGIGVQYTDEALLSGNRNNLPTEISDQIAQSIADKVDLKFLAAMNNVSMTSEIPSSGNIANAIMNGVMQFGEDLDGDKVLLVDPQLYARIAATNEWIANTELGANALIRGVVGEISGCQVAVSNRLMTQYDYELTEDTAIDSTKTYYTRDIFYRYTAVETPVLADIGKYYERTKLYDPAAYIVKPGALRLVNKRETLIEYDRDIVDQTNYVVGSKIFAPYVYDERKIVKLTFA